MRNKKKLVHALKSCYEPPGPERKAEFIRRMKRGNMSKLNLWEILRAQCRYVSKWTWLGVTVFLLVAVVVGEFGDSRCAGMVSAMAPFLAVLALSEVTRSARHGMDEMEMAARFSLKSIIFMRLLLVGIADVFLLVVAAVLMRGMGAIMIFYILLPYLVTTLGGLTVVRTYRTGENMYICAGFASAVALITGILPINMPELFETGYQYLWILANIVMAVMVWRECQRMIQTELALE